MGLLDLFRRKPDTSQPSESKRPEALLGVWHLLRSEALPYDMAELEILPDGRMHYSVREGEAWQVMKLTWCVDGEWLLSNQPSSPREERARFSIEPDGTLMLAFGGQKCWFRRGEKRTPPLPR